MTSSKAVETANAAHQDWVPLLEVAAREVFDLMLGCHLTVPPGTMESNLGVTSMVGLAGKLCGVLSIRCDRTSATLMASKMLGVSPDAVGPDMADAIGEICNMVAGNFKNKIPGLGDGCMLSPPTVITGSDYSMHSTANSQSINLDLLFENMLVTISLEVDG